MPKLTLEELRKGREEARSKIHLRGDEFKGRVIVHLGTCGIAAGARNIVLAFLDQKERNQVTDVLVTTSGCAGLCSREPMATVELTGGPPVKYGDLTAEKAARIFEEHLLGGRIVQEYAIGIGSERGG